MEATMILPVLNTETLQKKANEYAMQGAIKSIEEYYCGYNSPFRKTIEEELKKTELGHGSIALPDVISLINDSLSKEIDVIANTAISKTFLPLVQRFLTRAQKETNFSDILKEFVEATDSKEFEDCSVTVKESSYGWLEVNISVDERTYDLTLHKDYHSEKEAVQKYNILSLPYNSDKHRQTMKISIDGASLELPFSGDILQDNFISFVARLIIANTKITMDCREFSEDMFPHDECHC